MYYISESLYSPHTTNNTSKPGHYEVGGKEFPTQSLWCFEFLKHARISTEVKSMNKLKILKRLIYLVFFLVSINIPIAVGANTLSQDIKQSLKKYLNTFAAGDLQGFQQVVSADYIKKMGGIKRVKALLAQSKSHVGKKTHDITDLKVKSRGKTKVMAQFTSITPLGKHEVMEGGNWFILTKTNNKWIIADFITHSYLD